MISPEQQELVKQLMAQHHNIISAAVKNWSGTPVIPPSVHNYTEMFLEKLAVILK